MRAITVDSHGTTPALREDLPAPAPTDNERAVRRIRAGCGSIT